MNLNIFFPFPHPINEFTARIVAGIIACVGILTILMIELRPQIGQYLLLFLTYGFIARTLWGPRFSPIALLTTKIIIPAIGNPNKLVAGPPKRFAQFIGLIFTVTATALFFINNTTSLNTSILLGILVAFASIEAILGFCTGCFVFQYLIKIGLISQTICDKCAEFSKK